MEREKTWSVSFRTCAHRRATVEKSPLMADTLAVFPLQTTGRRAQKTGTFEMKKTRKKFLTPLLSNVWVTKS